ncbi:MAG TPA: hypothetical protein VFL38_06870, partial [Humibacillus xanthopallidus]|nr:hypothetical protein [Humibacillus xanthopallidus]
MAGATVEVLGTPVDTECAPFPVDGRLVPDVVSSYAVWRGVVVSSFSSNEVPDGVSGFWVMGMPFLRTGHGEPSSRAG